MVKPTTLGTKPVVRVATIERVCHNHKGLTTGPHAFTFPLRTMHARIQLIPCAWHLADVANNHSTLITKGSTVEIIGKSGLVHLVCFILE